MPTYTSNYNLALPLVNNVVDSDLWGGYLNGDMSELDGLVSTAINDLTSAKTTSFSVTAPVSASSNTGDSNTYFICDATAGAIIATLPLASTTRSGFKVSFKKIDSGVNTVTLTCSGSDKIDGSATLVISAQNDSYILVSDGVSAYNVQAYKHGTNAKAFSVNTQRFTGSATYTPTAGMVNCLVQMVGGGGGGGASTTSAGDNGAGGGGSGGYLEALLTSAQVGASQVITIGTAGTGGASSGASGVTGGNTTVGSLLTANGGVGGTGASAVGVTAGGGGGTAVVTTGTTNITMTGQSGQSGYGASNGLSIGGQGGSNPVGFGGPSSIIPASTDAAGINATGYGAGGSGGCTQVSTAKNGGNGTAGIVIITEYIYV